MKNRNNKQRVLFQKLLKDGPVTIIQLKDKQFMLEIVESGETDALTTIEAGDIPTILNNLKHKPAQAIELEAAIAVIEDQLMPIIKDLPKRHCLVTSEKTFSLT